MQLVFGMPIMQGTWPPDLSRELADAARAALSQNVNAIGTGFGGARNRLPELEGSTIAKKGNSKQILETRNMQDAMTTIVTRDDAMALISTIMEPADEWGTDSVTPNNTSEVARMLITGTAPRAKKKFMFFGISTGVFETFMINIQESYARQIGARAVGWPRLMGASNVSGGIADPGDGLYEVDINGRGSAALRRA